MKFTRTGPVLRALAALLALLWFGAMAHALDEGASRAHPIIDAVVSFKSVRESRDFWAAFLEQWPPALGDLYIVVDEEYGNTTEWIIFKNCLSKTSYVPKFAVLQKEKRFLKDSDFFWRLSGFTKNHWKFWLDEIVPPAPDGRDRVIAIIDDDSCLVDHFVADDIVNPVTGQLVAHGLHVDKHGYHLANHNPKARNRLDSWAKWTLDIGLPWWGNFMTDFPVFFWREMLPDLRTWMIESGLRKTMSSDPEQIKTDFWKVYQKYFRDTPGGHYCEFCLILNYAYMSLKWRERYEWRLAPTNISLGMSLHQHLPGCPTREQLSKLREQLLYYPLNLRTHFHPATRQFRAKFKPYGWFWQQLAMPEFLEHWKRGPRVSNATIWDTGTDLTMKAKEGGLDEQPKIRRGPSTEYDWATWKSYDAGGDQTQWEALLRQHEYRVFDWKTQQGKALSHVEQDPTITDKWRTCFLRRG